MLTGLQQLGDLRTGYVFRLRDPLRRQLDLPPYPVDEPHIVLNGYRLPEYRTPETDCYYPLNAMPASFGGYLDEPVEICDYIKPASGTTADLSSDGLNSLAELTRARDRRINADRAMLSYHWSSAAADHFLAGLTELRAHQFVIDVPVTSGRERPVVLTGLGVAEAIRHGLFL